MSNQYLSFDVTKQSTPQQLITGRQGDSQLKFVTMLFWDGDKNVPYDLTGKQVAFEALKPDDTHIVDYEGITILDAPAGLVRYSFNEQVFSVAGTMQQAFFKITHTDNDNNVIADSTLEVAINILENRVEFGINSKDYLSEYDKLVAEVEKKFDDYAATVQDSIDKAQALHEQIVEYTNLINSNGVITKNDFGDISKIKQPMGTDVVDKLNNEFSDRGVNVKWYGAKGDGITDDTVAINNAIVEAYQTGSNLVIIPTGKYMVKAHVPGFEDNYLKDDGGIKLLSNVTLLMDNNATISAIPNNMNQYVILRLYGVNNVNVIGGTIQGERDSHIGTTGEWGYGIAISGSTNINIDRVKITSCWGDGINLQVLDDASATPNRNIHISNVISTLNRRQGMSVESVLGLLVENSEFSYTSGTAPQTGVDIEPWSDTHPVENMKFINCRFIGNHDTGLMALTGAVTNLTVQNSLFSGNTGTGTGNGQIVTYIKSNCNGVKILNNKFVNDRVYSMTLRGGNNYVIDGNEMEQGIIMGAGQDGGIVNNVNIINNTVTLIPSASPMFDTIALTDIDTLKLNNNKFDLSKNYNGRAILFLTRVVNSVIIGNNFINSPYALSVSDSLNTVFSFNTIDNSGIISIQCGGNSKDIKIIGNNIYGSCHKSNGGSVIYMSGTANGAIIRDNKIYQAARRLDTANFGSGVEIYTFQHDTNAGLDTQSSNNINVGDGTHSNPSFLEYNSSGLTTGYMGEGPGGMMMTSNGKMVTQPSNGLIYYNTTQNKLFAYINNNWVAITA